MVAPKKPTAGGQSQVFGQVLRDFRRASGLTQSELAARAGISIGYVGMLETSERGRRTSLEIVEKLADGLRLTASQRQTLAAAAGISLGLHQDRNGSAPQTPFPVFVDSLGELSRQEKKLLNLLYRQFMESKVEAV